MVDDYAQAPEDDGAAWHQMQLEQEEWLEELARDEAARREFEAWLASTYEPDMDKDTTCHAPAK